MRTQCLCTLWILYLIKHYFLRLAASFIHFFLQNYLIVRYKLASCFQQRREISWRQDFASFLKKLCPLYCPLLGHLAQHGETGTQ